MRGPVPPVVAELDSQQCEEVGVEGVPRQVVEAPVAVDPAVERDLGASEDEAAADQSEELKTPLWKICHDHYSENHVASPSPFPDFLTLFC